MSKAPEEKLPRVTRRRMILGGALAGGALLVGYTATYPQQAIGALLQAGGSDPEPSAFGPHLRIEPDGWVTVVNQQQEMGQGIHTGLAAMIAEELDADWSRVRVVDAKGNFRAYGPQFTAGSRSVTSNWDAFRNAGAAARAMFVDAAASRWRVPGHTIQVRDGIVSHPASQRAASFADLLAEAARQSPPQEPKLKQRKDYRLIGTDRVRRKDSLPKSSGRQVYTQDLHLPNMLTAMVLHSPRFGGRLRKFDASNARKIKGVVDVFAIDAGVAVVAENTFAARRGREALSAEWDDSEAEKRSSAEIMSHYREIAAGATDLDPSQFQKRGEVDAPFGAGAMDITMEFPYLAHAPMETMDCVAQIKGWDVTIWSATQIATVDQIQAARVAFTLPGKVTINVLPAGGSFGRRGVTSVDYVIECLEIAKRTNGRPVKLIWTREDDMSGGQYRPMVVHRAWIELNKDGYPSRWRHHSVSQALMPIIPNEFAIEGIDESPYFSTASTVDCKVFTPDFPVPATFWRSVGNSHTAMVIEHIVDRLARHSGHDPAEYRRTLYRKAGAKHRLAVLDALCRAASWGKTLEPGWAQGMAVHESFGTTVGQVAEVKIEDGIPKVRRVVCVIDCGIAVSPDQVAAQMEGAVGFGLSAALYGAVTLKEGIVQETNFHAYRVVRMNEMPLVETHILASGERPTGVGEPGVPPIAPAVANAMLKLTGKPILSLPILSA